MGGGALGGPRAVKSKSFAQEDGQGLVEFALILPFILVLILGVVDIGRALGYKNDMTSLASQAARIAAVNSCSSCNIPGPGDPLTKYIQSIAPTELKSGSSAVDPITITYSFPLNSNTPPTSGCKGDPVKVTITTNYRWLSFLVGKTAVPGDHIGMSSSATMRMESNYDAASLSNIFTPTSPPSPPASGCPS
jgi:Flp pilus assembly protein TadG